MTLFSTLTASLQAKRVLRGAQFSCLTLALGLAACSSTVPNTRKAPAQPASNQTQTAAVNPAQFVVSQAIENYETHTAWIEKLRRNEKVRIVQIGDSHTAGDYFSNEARHILQQRFGDGGIGYVAPTTVSGQRNSQVSHTEGDWQTLSSRNVSDTPWGGVFARSLGTAPLMISANGTVFGKQRIQLAVRPLTSGSKLAVFSPQDSATRLENQPKQWQVVQTEMAMPLYISAESGAWDIGQVYIENTRPNGVVYSALGINGSQLSQWYTKWRQGWEEELQASQADIVVLAYGTNEAFNDNLDLAQTEQTWRNAIQTIRQRLPNAAIVIIGAPESLRNGQRPWLLDSVQAMQHRLAQSEKTLFWSWQKSMGGVGSMSTWVMQGLAARDNVHFNASGYRALGNQFAQALISLTTATPVAPAQSVQPSQ